MSQPVGFNAPFLSGAAFNENDELVFSNADGSTLAPIVIPDAAGIFSDNGDSTWSIGGDA